MLEEHIPATRGRELQTLWTDFHFQTCHEDGCPSLPRSTVPLWGASGVPQQNKARNLGVASSL